MCVMNNTVLVKPERGDPCWQDNLPIVRASKLITTPTPSTEDLVQEDLLQKCHERVERLSQQDRLIKMCA